MFLRPAYWMLPVALALVAVPLCAAPPLHERIDALIEAHPGFRNPAPTADDAAFLRRAYLDLAGTIPTARQVRDFLNDPAADKRARTIDRLLASPEHACRLQYVFDEMLMERRPFKHVSAGDWQTYLREAFRANRPWDELVRELLAADGMEEPRSAARFLLDRELDMDAVTRDLGRIFLGRDLQCAQCHDHPHIDSYLQRHYHGLAAFIKRSYLFKDKENDSVSIGEKAEGGDIEFTSVFTEETDRTAPRMLNSSPVEDPPAAKNRYQVKPAKNVRSVPVYSRRLQLAKAITAAENVPFRRNIANRLWALMMGRGLVEPLDMLHADNPPSHPELLDLLADSLLEHNYDLRYLLRELALTRAYQRDSRQTAAGANSGERYSAGLLKPLSPEQLAWSMREATGAAGCLAAQEKDPARRERDEEVAAFAEVFGSAGQTTRFDAAAGQALFLRNAALIQSWINADRGLAERMRQAADRRAAEDLYLSVFSRLPSPDERDRAANYLQSHRDRAAAVRHLIWAALASAEFRFNH